MVEGLAALQDLYRDLLYISFNGWGEDREAYFTIPQRNTGDRSEIGVKNERAHRELELLDREVSHLAEDFLRRLDRIGNGRT